jgi:hypothetical protein
VYREPRTVYVEPGYQVQARPMVPRSEIREEREEHREEERQERQERRHH